MGFNNVLLNAIVSLALIFVIAAESVVKHNDGIKIYPAVEEIISKPGLNITLRCEGKEPLTWDYPPLDESEEESNIYKFVSNPLDENSPYEILLNIINVTTKNVGYYSCKYNLSDYSKMPQLEEEAKNIYLFVNDSTQLIKEMDNLINVLEFKNILIPCIPTSPDVNVTLYVNDEQVIPNKRIRILNNRRVAYNKYSGFTIPDAQPSDVNLRYNCTASKNNNTFESHFYHVQVQHVTTSVHSPTIMDRDNGKNIVGGEIHLNCKIDLEDAISFDLSWDIPNKNIEPIQTPTLKTYSDERKSNVIGSKNITIPNVTKADQGTYTCTVKDNSNNTNSAETEIIVYDKGTSFINFKDPDVDNRFGIIKNEDLIAEGDTVYIRNEKF